MVAPRSLPDSVEAHPELPACRPFRSPDGGRIDALADRWAQLAYDGDPGAAAYLATLLRKLAAVLRAEPYWPLSARAIGGARVPQSGNSPGTWRGTWMGVPPATGTV